MARVIKFPSRAISIVKDTPEHTITIIHRDEDNEFLIKEDFFGQIDIIVLSAPQFIKLLQDGLTHFGLANGTVDKLATKLVQ